MGQTAKDFQPADEVFGVTGFAGGGLAEYGCAPEEKLVLKPVSSSFQEAAAIPIAGVTALQGLRDHGRIQPGQKVLVDGASGGVGTLAIQIAKSFGAEAAAVCSTDKMDTARSIGADHVIDYTREDFTKRAHGYDLDSGQRMPIIRCSSTAACCMGAERMLLSEAACRKFSNRCCSPASYHELEEKRRASLSPV